MSQINKTFVKYVSKKYIYPAIASFLYICYLFYNNYKVSNENERSSILFNKILNREVELKPNIISKKNIYGKLCEIVELSEEFNSGKADLDLDFIHMNFRMKSIFSVLTLNRNPNTLGYLEKRGSPWLGFVTFLKIIDNKVKPKLGEFAFCNSLIVGKEKVTIDDIDNTSENCTSTLNLNRRID